MRNLFRYFKIIGAEDHLHTQELEVLNQPGVGTHLCSSGCYRRWIFVVVKEYLRVGDRYIAVM